jgi:hypothetical protein
MTSAQSTRLAALSTDPIRVENADAGTVGTKLASVQVEVVRRGGSRRLHFGFDLDFSSRGRCIGPAPAVATTTGFIDESNT